MQSIHSHRHRFYVVFGAALLALAAVSAGSDAAQTQKQTQPLPRALSDVEKGKAAYLSAGCDNCHGTVGHGGAGARLAPNPLPTPAFIAYVRSGRRGWSVAGGMPAYPATKLSDQVLTDIRAYLASIPAPPPAKSIPLLRD